MKTKLFALILSCALLLSFFAASNHCYAADSYLITVAEDSVLTDVSDNGMAVYIDGIIYTPYTTVQKLSGIYVTYNKTGQRVTVFKSGYIMFFDLDTGLTHSYDEREIAISAKMRGDVPYLPIQTVCAWLDLSFTFLSAADAGLNYPVIRLSAEAPATSSSSMLTKLSDDLQAVASARDGTAGNVAPVPEEIPARDVQLMFSGMPDDRLPDVLSTLDSYRFRAAFFLSRDSLLQAADGVLQILAAGHPLGILLTEGSDPLAEADAAAALYASAFHLKVRLVYSPQPLSEDALAALREAGYCPWQPTLDPDVGELTAARLSSAARKALRNGGDDELLRLPAGGAAARVLPSLCSYLGSQNYTVRAADDWSEPRSAVN